MKQESATFDQISDKCKIHKIQVKVIEKSRPFQNPGKKKFQRLLLQDVKGDVIKGALFDDDIGAYNDLIQQNREYIITNPVLKPVDQRFQTKDNEYQMMFNARTIIEPICVEAQGTGPEYLNIAAIPRAAGLYDRFDVLGVVLYIGDVRNVKGGFERQCAVSDIYITDHSSHQPLIISAWNDLASFFEGKDALNKIVGFTSLKITTHRGFSLSTTMSSLILSEPTGPKVESLNQWVRSHGTLLMHRKEQILKIQTATTEREFATISAIKAKTVLNTIQEQRYWIRASINSFSYEDIRKFLACDGCNQKVYKAKYQTFDCPHCSKRESIAMPRLALAFTAEDSTGELQLTAFTDTLSKLLGKTIDEIYEPLNDEELTTLERIIKGLDEKPLCIEVGPTSALSKNGVLKWTLKSISSETNSHDGETQQTGSTSQHTLTSQTQQKMKSVATDIEVPATPPFTPQIKKGEKLKSIATDIEVPATPPFTPQIKIENKLKTVATNTVAAQNIQTPTRSKPVSPLLAASDITPSGSAPEAPLAAATVSKLAHDIVIPLGSTPISLSKPAATPPFTTQIKKEGPSKPTPVTVTPPFTPQIKKEGASKNESKVRRSLDFAETIDN